MNEITAPSVSLNGVDGGVFISLNTVSVFLRRVRGSGGVQSSE